MTNKKKLSVEKQIAIYDMLNARCTVTDEGVNGFLTWKQIKDIYNFLSEEPVSTIWHDVSELTTAREFEYLLVIYKDSTSPRVAGNNTQVSYWDRVEKWCYLDDILKLEKEPVSEDLEEASKEWLRPQLDKSYAKYGDAKMMELTRFDGYAMLDAIELGAKWQKEQMTKK